jgi:hypothetical protein
MFVSLKWLGWIGIRASSIWSTNRKYCKLNICQHTEHIGTDEHRTQQGASEKKGLKIGTNRILETAFVLSNYFAGFILPVKNDNLLRTVKIYWKLISSVFLCKGLWWKIKAFCVYGLVQQITATITEKHNCKFVNLLHNDYKMWLSIASHLELVRPDNALKDEIISKRIYAI